MAEKSMTSLGNNIPLGTIDDWTKDGDLGLGLGLKPGGIPNFCTSCPNQGNIHNVSAYSKWSGELPHFAYKCRKQQFCKSNDKDLCKVHSNIKYQLSRTQSERNYCKLIPCSNKKRLSLCLPKEEFWDEAISDLGPINENSFTISTSVQRQRAAFHCELKKILTKYTSSLPLINNIPKNGAQQKNNESNNLLESLQEELRAAHEKIDILQAELEVYQQLLCAKYKASEVLLQQLSLISEEKGKFENESKIQMAELQKLINSLQFNLEYTESQLSESQQLWLERFDSVAKENLEITETLKFQAQLIKKMTAEKLILRHERDELLAVMDAKERVAYHQSSSLSSEDSWSEITSLELGVLGACTCRGTCQEPCSCARMACIKQYKITDLSNEVQKVQNQLKEALSMINVYREAFEEQLKKNRSLMKRLSDIEVIYETTAKHQRRNGLLKAKNQVKDKSEVINALVDLLCDKNEELIQQRIVSKMLAKMIVKLDTCEENGILWYSSSSAPGSLECFNCNEMK